MRLRKLDIVGWEPCVLRFLTSRSESHFESLEKFLSVWIRQEDRGSGCGCKHRYSGFHVTSHEPALVLETEWMCESCVRALALAIESKFPSISCIELGQRVECPASRPSQTFTVPEKEVVLEGGTRARVASFELGRAPVTVAEFSEFARTTGYVTVAERRGNLESFREHFGLSGLAARASDEAPAVLVAPLDAYEYCRFRGCRLPTELEWLAAAVPDFREIELTPSQELALIPQARGSGNFVASGWEITASHSSDGLVVARCGPVGFVKNGWRDGKQLRCHRRLMTEDHYDIDIEFRIVVQTGATSPAAV